MRYEDTWKYDAACRGADPALFFTEDTGKQDHAMSFCVACTVRFECLEYALTTPSTTGTWGGTSEQERRKLRRYRNRAVNRRDEVDLRRAVERVL